VFHVRHEHHLHIKSKAIPGTGCGGPRVFPVRHEHHLHIKSKAIPVTDRGGTRVFHVRHEHHLHIKSKAIPGTGCGGPRVFPVRPDKTQVLCHAEIRRSRIPQSSGLQSGVGVRPRGTRRHLTGYVKLIYIYICIPT
jgi:hypothetical protein